MTSTSPAIRLMGTEVNIAVVGTSISADEVAEHLAQLERSWSRFRVDSELTRMNDAAGRFTVVSSTLWGLLELLVTAERLTGGRFDPLLGTRMADLGYDRSWQDIDPADAALPAPRAARSATIELFGSIALNSPTRSVLLPVGAAVDPGGLGKGLAADLAGAAAMAAGASGVLIDMGGDVVTRGSAPDGGPWRIGVPATGNSPAWVAELRNGAVATSHTAARTWRRGDADVHHIVDPADGQPIERDLTATVIAGAGWWAEAAATAAIVSTARADGWVATLRNGGTSAAVVVTEREVTSA